ncbi:MAG: hypothetical protein OSA98_23985 [Rubripirellula sp.]|nr:hypothetical protein [Rubripirellula sp.]
MCFSVQVLCRRPIKREPRVSEALMYLMIAVSLSEVEEWVAVFVVMEAVVEGDHPEKG